LRCVITMNKRNFVFIFFIGLFCNCQRAIPQNKSTRFATYDSLIAYTQKQQAAFKTLYTEAPAAQKATVLSAAHDTVLHLIINDYFGFWYGTPWGFYGTTRTPDEGKIACGYFVTTVLYDAGFKIPRTSWAQVASETMIKAMTTHIKKFSNRPITEVESYIKTTGKGLYVVGLDSHTGFIYNDGNTIRFVHSNYYMAADGVMAQELDSHNPLKDSKYRVVGKILDDEMMKSWILGKKIE
jgi:hypothetical protein